MLPQQQQQMHEHEVSNGEAPKGQLEKQPPPASLNVVAPPVGDSGSANASQSSRWLDFIAKLPEFHRAEAEFFSSQFKLEDDEAVAKRPRSA